MTAQGLRMLSVEHAKPQREIRTRARLRDLRVPAKKVGVRKGVLGVDARTGVSRLNIVWEAVSAKLTEPKRSRAHSMWCSSSSCP
jgi:hypothetical protein